MDRRAPARAAGGGRTTPDTQEVVFTGLDRGIEGGVEQDYQRSLPLAVVQDADVLLAWAMNGAPLEPQHGAPLRLIVPGWYGMAHVKWLAGIEAIGHTSPATSIRLTATASRARRPASR